MLSLMRTTRIHRIALRILPSTTNLTRTHRSQCFDQPHIFLNLYTSKFSTTAARDASRKSRKKNHKGLLQGLEHHNKEIAAAELSASCHQLKDTGMSSEAVDTLDKLGTVVAVTIMIATAIGFAILVDAAFMGGAFFFGNAPAREEAERIQAMQMVLEVTMRSGNGGNELEMTGTAWRERSII